MADGISPTNRGRAPDEFPQTHQSNISLDVCLTLDRIEKSKLARILANYPEEMQAKIMACFSCEIFQKRCSALEGKVLELEATVLTHWEQLKTICPKLNRRINALKISIEQSKRNASDLDGMHQILADIRNMLKLQLEDNLPVASQLPGWADIELALLRIHRPPQWMFLDKLSAIAQSGVDKDEQSLAAELDIHSTTTVKDVVLLKTSAHSDESVK